MGVKRGDGMEGTCCIRRRRVLPVVLLLFASACSGYVRHSAVRAIASQLQPQSGLAEKLESAANPAGEAVIVFVRDGSSCTPRYAWVWLNESTPAFALDTASQALTPRLNTLSSAPPEILQRIGSESQVLTGAVRQAVCQVAEK
jgi:hypothetical protein